MRPSKLTKLEMQIMEALWTHGLLSIREIRKISPQERTARLPTTVQTTAAWK